MLDPPANDFEADVMTLVLDTPTIHASLVSQARVVDTLIHSLVGTQASVADSLMTRAILGPQARVVDTRITHA